MMKRGYKDEDLISLCTVGEVFLADLFLSYRKGSLNHKRIYGLEEWEIENRYARYLTADDMEGGEMGRAFCASSLSFSLYGDKITHVENKGDETGCIHWSLITLLLALQSGGKWIETFNSALTRSAMMLGFTPRSWRPYRGRKFIDMKTKKRLGYIPIFLMEAPRGNETPTLMGNMVKRYRDHEEFKKALKDVPRRDK